MQTERQLCATAARGAAAATTMTPAARSLTTSDRRSAALMTSKKRQLLDRCKRPDATRIIGASPSTSSCANRRSRHPAACPAHRAAALEPDRRRGDRSRPVQRGGRSRTGRCAFPMARSGGVVVYYSHRDETRAHECGCRLLFRSRDPWCRIVRTDAAGDLGCTDSSRSVSRRTGAQCRDGQPLLLAEPGVGRRSLPRDPVALPAGVRGKRGTRDVRTRCVSPRTCACAGRRYLLLARPGGRVANVSRRAVELPRGARRQRRIVRAVRTGDRRCSDIDAGRRGDDLHRRRAGWQHRCDFRGRTERERSARCDRAIRGSQRRTPSERRVPAGSVGVGRLERTLLLGRAGVVGGAERVHRHTDVPTGTRAAGRQLRCPSAAGTVGRDQ